MRSPRRPCEITVVQDDAGVTSLSRLPRTECHHQPVRWRVAPRSRPTRKLSRSFRFLKKRASRWSAVRGDER